MATPLRSCRPGIPSFGLNILKLSRVDQSITFQTSFHLCANAQALTDSFTLSLSSSPAQSSVHRSDAL